MRNPSYDYKPHPTGGWIITWGDMEIYGKTKEAARSRLLRVVRHNQRIDDVAEALKTEKGEVNDQS
jgi:hypothetical protein